MSVLMEYRILTAMDEVALALAVQALIDARPTAAEWRPLGPPFIKYHLTSSSNYSNVLQTNVLTDVGSFCEFCQAMVCYTRGGGD